MAITSLKTGSSFTNLQKYGTFLANNFLTALPDSIAKLQSLVTLLLYNNTLIGPLPESIGNLTNLMYLHVANINNK